MADEKKDDQADRKVKHRGLAPPPQWKERVDFLTTVQRNAFVALARAHYLASGAAATIWPVAGALSWVVWIWRERRHLHLAGKYASRVDRLGIAGCSIDDLNVLQAIRRAQKYYVSAREYIEEALARPELEEGLAYALLLIGHAECELARGSRFNAQRSLLDALVMPVSDAGQKVLLLITAASLYKKMHSQIEYETRKKEAEDLAIANGLIDLIEKVQSI